MVLPELLRITEHPGLSIAAALAWNGKIQLAIALMDFGNLEALLAGMILELMQISTM